MRKLQEEILFLEKELSRKSEYANTLLNQPKPDWMQVKGSLKPGEVAIEILRSRNSFNPMDSGEYSPYIPGNQEPKIIKLGNATWAETGALVNTSQSILNDKDSLLL